MLEWQSKFTEDDDFDLNCELWTKIANLALNVNTVEMTKMAIKFLENALIEPKEKSRITKNGLRWYSFAEYLYAKSICIIIDTKGLEFETKDYLLFKSIQYLISACNKSLKCNKKKIFLDCVKKFYKISMKIFENYKTDENLALLAKPIFSVFYYLKEANE